MNKKNLSDILIMMSVMFVVIGLSVAISAYNKYQKDQKERRMDIAKSSYETGCYNFAQRYGLSLHNEQERDRVFQLALSECDSMSKEYRRWLGRYGR